MEEYKEIISLKDASKLTGYTTDYLGYLIRTGKLTGKKMGRTWVTSKSDLEQYLSKSQYHALTKLLSYCFSQKAMFYASLAVIAILAYILYFHPFTVIQSQAIPGNANQSPEIDNDLHL